jgi:AcrR family transcriptional regulator
VAAAAHVDVATLHYHFPDKEELVRGVVGHALARFQETLPRTGRPADQLRGHFAGLRKLSRDEPGLFAVMGELWLRAGRDPAVGTILRRTDRVWHSTLTDLLRAAKRDGTIAASLDPEAAAMLIVAGLKGLYVLPGVASAPRRLDATLDQLERWLGLKRSR